MNKVKLEFAKNESISIGEYGGEEVYVETYIPYEDYLTICSRYLATYFLSEGVNELNEWNYLGAEQEKDLYILDNYTNILVFDEDENLVLDWDGVLASGIISSLANSIVNYYKLSEDIWLLVDSVKHKKAMDSSFKKVLDDIVSSLIGFAEGLSDIEMTEDGFKKIVEEISKMSNVLKDSPVSNILEDANRR